MVRMDKLSAKTVTLGFLSGAIALFFSALVFNLYSGVSAYTMQSYIIPIVYGCGGGAIVGYYVWKSSTIEDTIITVSARLSKVELLLTEKNANLTRMRQDLEDVVRGRIEVEQLYEQSSMRYKSVLANISNGVAVFEPRDGGKDFVCMDMNKIGKHMTDVVMYACGKSVSALWPSSEMNGILKAMQEAWAEKKPRRVITTEYGIDGILTRSVSYYLYTLDFNELMVIFNDITDEKLAEAKIKELEREIMALHTMMHAPQYDAGETGVIYLSQVSADTAYVSEPYVLDDTATASLASSRYESN